MNMFQSKCMFLKYYFKYKLKKEIVIWEILHFWFLASFYCKDTFLFLSSFFCTN